MFYVASNGPASIIVTANEIYGIKQSSWLKRRIKSIILTFILVILYLFIILVPVLGVKIIDAIDYFNIKSTITSILSIMQGPISWLIIYIFIKTIFTLAPDKKISASQINVGAVFTTIGWILTTYIYGYYASHFARYELFYAGLSNIAVLMLWIYILSYILVIGLSLTTKFNDEELEKTGSINKD
jgi:membrane protein